MLNIENVEGSLKHQGGQSTEKSLVQIKSTYTIFSKICSSIESLGKLVITICAMYYEAMLVMDEKCSYCVSAYIVGKFSRYSTQLSCLYCCTNVILVIF